MADDLDAARRALYRRGATEADRSRYARLAQQQPAASLASAADEPRSRPPRRTVRTAVVVLAAAAALSGLAAIGAAHRTAAATPTPGMTVALGAKDGGVRSAAADGAALNLTVLPYGWQTPRITDLQHGTSGPTVLRAPLHGAAAQVLVAIACRAEGSAPPSFRITVRVGGERTGAPVTGSCASQSLQGVQLPAGSGTATVTVRTRDAAASTAALLTQ